MAGTAADRVTRKNVPRVSVMIRCGLALQALLVWTSVSLAQDAAAEARRHLLRGIAAIEMAKSDADLTLAADEFRRATVIAPNLAAAWFNLGKVQAKLEDYAGAIQSYKRYLVLAPSAPDASEIGDEIIKLEFRQERSATIRSRAGTWVAEDGTSYRLVIDGTRITLSTADYHVKDDEAVSHYPIAGTLPITAPVSMQYVLALQGNRVTGTWSRSAVKAEACVIPAEQGEVSGEFHDADRMLKLRYTRTKYHAFTVISILTDDSCQEVRVVDKREVETSFFGPLGERGPRRRSRRDPLVLGGRVLQSSVRLERPSGGGQDRPAIEGLCGRPVGEGRDPRHRQRGRQHPVGQRRHPAAAGEAGNRGHPLGAAQERR